jgi:alkylhydroperoxidase family enzyme
MRIPASRLSLLEHAQRQSAAMLRLEQSIELDRGFRDLVALRASQINGCAFCLDMHWKDAEDVPFAVEFRRGGPVISWRSRA